MNGCVIDDDNNTRALCSLSAHVSALLPDPPGNQPSNGRQRLVRAVGGARGLYCRRDELSHLRVHRYVAAYQCTISLSSAATINARCRLIMLSCQLAFLCMLCVIHGRIDGLRHTWAHRSVSGFRFVVKSGVDSFILRNDLQVSLSWLYCSTAHFHMTDSTGRIIADSYFIMRQLILFRTMFFAAGFLTW